MKSSFLVMGLEIQTAPGPVLKPTFLKLGNSFSKSSQLTPAAPLKFMNDSLVGLHFHQLTDFSHLEPSQIPFAQLAKESLCPYYSLFYSSSDRLVKITEKIKPASETECLNFENQWLSYWESLDFTAGIDLKKLSYLSELISEFELKTGKPLVYNFGLRFSQKMTDHLLSMYSMLFHLRSLVALDHNAHVDDSSFESIQCDSISDYLPRADFTTNDALIYWQFKKLATPFVGHKDKDVRIEKLFVEPMQRAFDQYNHNACALINQLPQDMLAGHANTELEHDLYQIQMDWLLGSSAGLLFRLREEFFGLQQGYEKIFWPEAAHAKPKKSASLNLCFKLSESDLRQSSAA